MMFVLVLHASCSNMVIVYAPFVLSLFLPCITANVESLRECREESNDVLVCGWKKDGIYVATRLYPHVRIVQFDRFFARSSIFVRFLLCLLQKLKIDSD